MFVFAGDNRGTTIREREIAAHRHLLPANDSVRPAAITQSKDKAVAYPFTLAQGGGVAEGWGESARVLRPRQGVIACRGRKKKPPGCRIPAVPYWTGATGEEVGTVSYSVIISTAALASRCGHDPAVGSRGVSQGEIRNRRLS